MSLPVHAEITGEKQGKIEGTCEMQGRENTILVHHVHHEITIPTGEKGGRRVHAPLTITKSIDAATPKLKQAISSSELLTEVLIKWYRHSDIGPEEMYYSVVLENCRITSYIIDMELENVSFSYEKITWKWENPPIETTDTWEMPG